LIIAGCEKPDFNLFSLREILFSKREKDEANGHATRR
jgi:hypothetical protein